MISPTRIFASQDDARVFIIEYKAGHLVQRPGETVDVDGIGACRIDTIGIGQATVTALPRSSNVTHIGIVLDESGSMFGCADRTISALNEYLDTLRAQRLAYKVTLATFNTNEYTKFRYREQDIREIPKFPRHEYNPASGTPLYDATAGVIQYVANSKGRDPAILVILTDGEENASSTWTQAAIHKLITEKQAEGWAVVYLGADLSRESVARYSGAMGINAANTASYGKRNTQEMFQNLSTATRSYASSAGATASNTFERDAQSLATGTATVEELNKNKKKVDLSKQKGPTNG